MGIYDKLANIQSGLIVPKGNYNDFGNYSYRSCEDILKALKPLCDTQKCVCYISNALESINDRVYVKATVTLKDLESGEEIKSVAHAREDATKKGADGSQITGASSSYARKYALAGLFCIDNEKDADATNHGEESKPTTQKNEKIETDANKVIVGKVHIETIKRELERTGITQKSFITQMQIKSIEGMTMAEFTRAMGMFSKTPSKADR